MRAVTRLLNDFSDIFSKSKDDLGHRINTHQSPLNNNHIVFSCQKDKLKENVQRMLENNVIEPSSSPWACPIVTVTKKVLCRLQEA